MSELEWAAIRQGELDVLIEEIKRLRGERDLAVRVAIECMDSTTLYHVTYPSGTSPDDRKVWGAAAVTFAEARKVLAWYRERKSEGTGNGE